MKNNKGFMNVFSFTLVQNFKSKVMLTITIVLCVLAFASVPFANYILHSDDKKESSTNKITKVYINDEINLGISDNIQELKKGKFEDTAFEVKDMCESEAKKAIKNTDEVFLHVYVDEVINFDYIYDNTKALSDSDVQELSDLINSKLKDFEYDRFGISEEARKITSEEIKVCVSKVGEKKSANNLNQDIAVAMLCILVFVYTMSGEAVSNSVAMEKSTRVIEYLTINVKPVVLIMGKVTALLSTVLIQIIFTSLGFGVSSLIFGGKAVTKLIENSVTSGEGISFSATKILFALIILLGGILAFGLLAGLIGATVKTIDELGERMKVFSIIMIVGAYASMYLLFSGKINQGGMISTIAYIFPLTAAFITPSFIIFGKISTIVVILSLFAMIITDVIMVIFVSRVYEGILYYNGDTLKFKDIIRFSKNKRRGEKNV